MPLPGRLILLLLTAAIALATALSPHAAEQDSWIDRALERSRSTPLGLPPVTHPADNPPTRAKIELGRKLFFDRRLSHNGTMSCAMCHVPEQGFTNNELATPVGFEGKTVRRNSPTMLNVAYVESLFHDGRDPALETQFVSPMTAVNEMANPSIGFVVGRLAQLEDYAPLFQAAFGGGPTPDRIGQAFGAYQRTLLSGASRFDRWRYGGASDALTDQEKQGFELFTGKANCASCHSVGDRYALFSDGQFHDTGYGWRREQERQSKGPMVEVEMAPGVTTWVAPEVLLTIGDPPSPDLGRYEVTLDPVDRWRFRTPSLRNVELTAPYMHDGKLRSLNDVVTFYNKGGAPHEGVDPRIRPLDLTPAETEALVAFLQSLTGDNIEQLIAEARSAAPDNIR